MAWLIQNNAQFQVQTTTILEALPELIASLEDYDAADLADMDLGDLTDEDTRTIVDDQDDPEDTNTDSSAEASDTTDNVSDAADNGADISADTANDAGSADSADSADAANSGDTADVSDTADTGDTQTLSRAHIEKHDVPLVAASSSVDLATLYKMLSKIDKDSREFSQVASNLMDNVGDAAEYGADLTDSMDLMIEDLTALHDSLICIIRTCRIP